MTGRRLSFDSPGEIVVLRRKLAGQHEILPDQHAVLVAVVEKVVILVDAAAPAADHVAAEVREEFEAPAMRSRASPCIASAEPSRAVDEQRLAVQQEAELSGAAGDSDSVRSSRTVRIPVRKRRTATVSPSCSSSSVTS